MTRRGITRTLGFVTLMGAAGCSFPAPPWEGASRDAGAQGGGGLLPCRGGAVCVAELAMGFQHGCARTEDGRVYCWGSNRDGQVSHTPGGPNAGLLGSPPVLVTEAQGSATALRDVRHVAGGAESTCVVVGDRRLQCWGGDAAVNDRLPSEVLQLVAGSSHACVRTMMSGVQCWGLNREGQLGRGNRVLDTSPGPVLRGQGTGHIASLLAGHWHTCGVEFGGGVLCWGANGHGQLGLGAGTEALEPLRVSVLPSNVRAVRRGAAGLVHTCALVDDGSPDAGADDAVYCWGGNGVGQLGLGHVDAMFGAARPVLRDGGAALRAVRLAAGSGHTCALTSGGEVFCWGANEDGQCGQDPSRRPALLFATRVGGLPAGGEIAAGQYHTCVLARDRGVHCWGSNQNGQLGGGTARRSHEPVRVTFP